MDINAWLMPLWWEGIMTAMVCGLIIGLERQLSGKPAGIGVLIGFGRYSTSILISILTVGILIGMNFLETTFASFSRGIYTMLIPHKKKHQNDDEL